MNGKTGVPCLFILLWILLMIVSAGAEESKLKTPSITPADAPTTMPTTQPATNFPKEISLDLGGGVAIKCVLIPAGKFLMGGSPKDKNSWDDERPQHEVIFDKPFYMSIYEITQKQYVRIIGKNPSMFKGDQNPVEQVTWNDAVEYCKKASQKTGKLVRLPVEAEWEYACRAGSVTQYYFGDDKDGKQLKDYAWYADNSGAKTHPVGGKKPNAWGLYDMHGNLYEWCDDWYLEHYSKDGKSPQTQPARKLKVFRGGDWSHPSKDCRSAARKYHVPENNCNSWGFRIVVELK